MNSVLAGGAAPGTVRYNSNELSWPLERYSGYGRRTDGGARRKRDLDRARDRDGQAADRRAYVDARRAAAVDSRARADIESFEIDDRGGLRAIGRRRHHPLAPWCRF